MITGTAIPKRSRLFVSGRLLLEVANTMDLRIEHWPINQLVPYARNPRTHTPDQVAQVAGSIAEFGFVNPILVGPDNVIIAGHARLGAAQKLGLAEVPVIVL